ncbi:MAG: glycosyltransferase [Patescibacteria group bacterium]|nr:glycosyltransferase [Patescibacteria group bacterium]
MPIIQMISSELAPYRCYGGLGVAVENLSSQLVSLGMTTEVFFPLSDSPATVYHRINGLIPSTIDVPIDVVSQSDIELAPSLTIFCQKALSSLTRKSESCFIAHDNEAAISVVIGKQLGVPAVFWLHSLYDHPIRSDFPPAVRKLLKSESLLSSAISDSRMMVTSSGMLKDALSIKWPGRLQEIQQVIQDADRAKKIMLVESLGLLRERVASATNANAAAKYGLAKKPFVLFSSRPVLYKGIGFFELIAQKMRDEELKFVAVGCPSDEIRSLCPNILWIPWLKKDELFGLMAQAMAVAHPSLTEGYGLAAAESTKFNENVFCHPVGGLQILIECRLANEVPVTEEELCGFYELWSNLLATKSQRDAVAAWHEQSASFDGLMDRWVNNLSQKLLKGENFAWRESQARGGRPWQGMTWGETLLRANGKLRLY